MDTTSTMLTQLIAKESHRRNNYNHSHILPCRFVVKNETVCDLIILIIVCPFNNYHPKRPTLLSLHKLRIKHHSAFKIASVKLAARWSMKFTVEVSTFP